MSGTIVTELQDVSERLNPDISDRLAPNMTLDTAWPFLPKDSTMKSSPPKVCTPMTVTPRRQPAIDRRATLLRTSSFVKLRRFCNQSCDVFPNALLFMQTSRTTLEASISHAIVQLKECMLVLAVYLCVICLSLQLTACLYALAGKALPPGLIFMVASLFAIMATFSQLVVNVVAKRKSRTTKRVAFVAKKND